MVAYLIHGDLSWDALSQLGEISVYDNSAPEEVVERIGDAEIAIINKVVLSEKNLASVLT